jgi:hypothetical protein
MMNGGGEFTRLEKRYGGFPRASLELPKEAGNASMAVEISWDTIDHAANVYAKTLQEYNIGEIVKAVHKRIKKDKYYSILPSAGNLDLTDKEVGFHDFIVELEKAKAAAAAAGKGKTSVVLGRPSVQARLKTAAAPIVAYLLTGKHSKENKQFNGWKRGLTASQKKPMVAGILSIDLPQSAGHEGEHKYICGGTQHYIAFVYIKASGELYLFDSATKNPIRDHTEVYYILKYTFQELIGSAPLGIKRIPFKHVLQLGAGDRSVEDPHSYNNQNVFCHTWSLWFLTTFAILYDPSSSENAEKSIAALAKLAHPDEMLNLAMIKRFAFWLLDYIYEPETESKIASKFPLRAYQRAVERGETDRLKGILETYMKHKDPMVGLRYLYSYKNKTIISIDALATDQKLQMDIVQLYPGAA